MVFSPTTRPADLTINLRAEFRTRGGVRTRLRGQPRRGRVAL